MSDPLTPPEESTRLRDACLARWSTLQIPIQAATFKEIESLQAREDQVDANSLGELVASDALMSLRLLAQVAALRSPRSSGDPQTVTAALVWLGVGPFFRSSARIPLIEQTLADHPGALWRVERHLSESRRAARLTLAFAMQRGDPDAASLHHAALLNRFVELLLWVHEPASALRIECEQRADPLLSTQQAQQKVLGFEISDLKQPLQERWRLPRHLAWSGDPRHADDPSVQCIAYASRIAARERSGARSDSAVVDEAELSVLSDLLGVSQQEVMALIGETE